MSYNLLIVDDSSIVRKVFKKAVDMSGIDVGDMYEAENGLCGLEVLKSHAVDVIFLDINMPVVDGMEFMRRYNADSSLQSVPVVVVSTEGSKERIAELESLGIVGYLRKPVTPEQLAETVQRVLKKG